MLTAAVHTETWKNKERAATATTVPDTTRSLGRITTTLGNKQLHFTDEDSEHQRKLAKVIS